MPTLERQRERIETYKNAIDASSIVAITDAKGIITYANENFCAISKYSSSELIGQTHRIINSNYHSKEFFSDMWSAISSGKIWKGEIRNRAKDGTLYWVETTIVPFLDESGKPERFVSIRSDITDRKLAKERKFQMLFDNSHEGLLLARPDGTFIEVNSAFCEMLGYSHDEFLKLTRQDITLPDDTILQKGLIIRSETGYYKGLVKFKRKDGTIIDAEISSAIYKDENGEDRSYVSATDITEKLKAENTLRSNEHRLRSMIEHSHDIITLVNADGTMRYRSPSYAHIMGYGEADMEDRVLYEIVHPDDMPALKELFMKLMNAPGQSFKGKWRQKHKNGSYKWMEGVGTNLLNDPDVRAIVCNFRDITEHIETRQELEKSNRELNRLFNSIDEVLYSAEKNPFKLTQMSDACIKLYGYASSDFFEKGYLWFDLILPEDRSVIEHMNLMLDKGEPAFGQYRIRHRDNSIRWIEANVTPTLDEKGLLIRVDGVNRDITARKTAEEALVNNEKRFRTLIENSKDGIVLTNSNARFMYLSPAIKEILGYEPEELIGKYAYDVIHADFQQSDIQNMLKADDGLKQSADLVLKVKHKNGSWRWIEASISLRLNDPAVNAVVTNFRDVTEKKNAEEALLNSEKRFRALIENNKEGIGLTDRNQQFVYLSPSVKNILGYEPEELIGKGVFEHYHPDDQPKMLELAMSIRNESAASGSALVRIRHKDDSWRWIELTATNQLDDPAINAVVTNFRDITEKKIAEEALLNSEKRFRTLIENSKEILTLTDSSRKILYMSPSLKDTLGYEPIELIGNKIFELFHPDDQAHTTQMIRSLINKEKNFVVTQFRARHKNGSWRWLEATVTNQLDDPIISALVGNLRDVTEQKAAAEAVLYNERKFRTLIENNKEVISLSTPDRTIIYTSPAIKNVLGYDPEELIGIKSSSLMHPDEAVDNKIGRDQLAPGTAGTKILRLMHKDGTWRWVEMTTSNQLDNPAVNAMVTNFRDVTERKKAEDELEQLNQSLEKKVQERTIQLEESNKALESFSSLAAHDLQAPLRVLMGYAAILKEEYGRGLGDDGTAVLDIMVKQTKQMTQLVSGLLTFSRASHTIIKEEMVNLDEIVSEICRHLHLTYTGPSEVEIKVHKLGLISCDAGLIRQVWSNLISNALKYSAKAAKPMIEIGSSKNEGETVFYIKDNGAGFDMKKATKLFQVFQRLHSSSDFEGTGLGLALVKNIITRHGGRIWVESESGKGATFYFSIPD